MRKHQQGVSVVALAIGVAVIIVLAVVVIPTLLPSHLSANESSALASLQTLDSACGTYLMSYGGYPKSLANLGPGDSVSAKTAALIDSALASGAKDAYVFNYTPGATGISGNVLSYTITANPAKPGSSGRRFFTDQSGVVRANIGRSADLGSSPIARLLTGTEFSGPPDSAKRNTYKERGASALTCRSVFSGTLSYSPAARARSSSSEREISRVEKISLAE